MSQKWGEDFLAGHLSPTLFETLLVDFSAQDDKCSYIGMNSMYVFVLHTSLYTSNICTNYLANYFNVYV